MKRVNAFLIILIVAITALIASTALGFAMFSQTQNPYSWMQQMWSGNNANGYNGGYGGMMGGNSTTATTTSTWLPYFGVMFAVLIGVTILGIVGVAYYLVYPQIRMGAAPATITISEPTTPNIAAANNVNAYESVTKTLTEEERKVIEVLNSHNGKYLQKYIKAETGLSRLKTHRILARLSERGIVSLEKTGNTNQVYLASWLNQSG
jgi:predicted transcriptional regulator